MQIRNRFPLALMLLTLATPSCSGGTGTAPTDIKFDTIQMTLKDKPFTIEVADTQAKIERGLMFRPSMPADHGMLFVFEKPDPTIAFWMKNTLIPLDIVFIDSRGMVLEIQDRQPKDETGRGPSSPCQFVIELNAGTSKTIGLKAGDMIAIPAKFLKPAPAATEK